MSREAEKRHVVVGHHVDRCAVAAAGAPDIIADHRAEHGTVAAESCSAGNLGIVYDCNADCRLDMEKGNANCGAD